MNTELKIALISAIAALVSAGIAFYSQQKVASTEDRYSKELAGVEARYSKELEKLSNELTRLREASNLFRTQQLKLYLEASNVTAKIATLEPGDARTHAIQHFRELYWGNLAVFENKRVESAMVTFSQGLEKEEDPSVLSHKALRVAHACRDSLEDAWGVDLGPLENLRGQ